MQKTVLAILVVLLLLAVGLVVKQQQEIGGLRRDAELMRKELESTQGTVTNVPPPALVDSERDELLRLRGEVAMLRRQLEEKSRQTANSRPTPTASNPSDAPAQNWSVRTMNAQVQTTLDLGSTLVTGGWSSQPGKKTFVFLTPELNVGDTETPQLAFQSVIIEAPESVLKSFGLDRLQAQGDNSALNQIIPAGNNTDMLNSLREQPGIDVISAPVVSTADGNRAQISVGQTEVHPVTGQSVSLGPYINILPKLSEDHRRVQLDVQANINLKGTPQ